MLKTKEINLDLKERIVDAVTIHRIIGMDPNADDDDRVEQFKYILMINSKHTKRLQKLRQGESSTSQRKPNKNLLRGHR